MVISWQQVSYVDQRTILEAKECHFALCLLYKKQDLPTCQWLLKNPLLYHTSANFFEMPRLTVALNLVVMGCSLLRWIMPAGYSE